MINLRSISFSLATLIDLTNTSVKIPCKRGCRCNSGCSIAKITGILSGESGKSDPKFWESIYKFHGAVGSGESPYITGWITAFLPYLVDGKTRKATIKNNTNHVKVSTRNLPSGLGKAPFTWQYYEQTFSMEFVAGFVGIKQDDQGFLRPEIGWVILENE